MVVSRRNIFKQGAGALAAVGLTGGLATQANGQTLDTLGAGDPKHVVLMVLDRSGSMSGQQQAVTESINAYLDEQADKPTMHIGLVQFDDYKTKDNCFCEPIFTFTPASSTPRLELNDYQPRGSTPLLAAFVEAISKLEQVVRPIDRALIIVQTDGYENASPAEITKEVVKNLIKAKEAEGNFTFAFLGADIDAWGEGGSLGVHQGSTLSYANTATGTAGAYRMSAGSTSSWYASTGGGLDVVAAASAPTNTNTSFFVQPPTTPVIKPSKKRSTRVSKTPPPRA